MNLHTAQIKDHHHYNFVPAVILNSDFIIIIKLHRTRFSVHLQYDKGWLLSHKCTWMVFIGIVLSKDVLTTTGGVEPRLQWSLVVSIAVVI